MLQSADWQGCQPNLVNPKLGKSLNNIEAHESLEHVDIEGLVNKVHIKGKKLSKF